MVPVLFENQRQQYEGQFKGTRDPKYTRQRSSGLPRSTSASYYRFLVLQSLRNRAQTVRRRLTSGLSARRPVRVPRLTVEHKQQRLEFIKIYENWEERDGRIVLFSDESRFSLRSPDGRYRVWRRGERISEATVIQHEDFRGGPVTVWAEISLDAKTESFVLHGCSLNAHSARLCCSLSTVYCTRFLVHAG